MLNVEAPDQPVRPARRSQVKHRAILQAAVAAVAEGRFADVTIDAIAARAGVGKQTIYRWWPSKPALYVEVYADLVPPGLLSADLGSARADLEDRLCRLFRRLTETPAGAILVGLLALAQTDPVARAAITDGLVIGRRHLLHEPLLSGIARGDLAASFDVDWAADTMTARIWHALLLAPDGLTPAFARRLVAEVLR